MRRSISTAIPSVRPGRVLRPRCAQATRAAGGSGETSSRSRKPPPLRSEHQLPRLRRTSQVATATAHGTRMARPCHGQLGPSHRFAFGGRPGRGDRRLRLTSHPAHRAGRSRLRCSSEERLVGPISIATSPDGLNCDSLRRERPARMRTRSDRPRISRKDDRSAQIGAIGAVHGMRSQAEPTPDPAERSAEGESVRGVEPSVTRASHSRPMCRTDRDLWD